MLLASLGLVLVLAGAGVFIWKYRGNQALRPLLPGIGATVFGIALVVAMYAWVFELGPNCSSRGEFACQTNANQGLWTLLGVFLAAMALWTTVLTRHLDRRRETAQFGETVATALVAAMEEARHNLIHVALAYSDDGELRGIPMLAVSATADLVAPPIRRGLHPGVLHSAETLIRNHDALQLYAEGKASEDPQEQEPQEPFALEAFVTQSIGLLLWGGRSNEAGHDFLHQRGLHDIHAAALSDPLPYFCFRTSDKEFQAELATLRTDQRDVMCWWNDVPPERIKVYEEGPVFKDLSRAHTPH